MKKQKVQIAILACVLAAVIALGRWLVLRAPEEKTPDEPPANSGGTAQISTGSRPFDMFRFKPSVYRSVRQETEDLQHPPMAHYLLNNVFLYQDQFCRYAYHEGETEDDFSVDIVSMASNEVLRTYEAGGFYYGSSFTSLYIDQDDVLWAVYYMWETETTFLCPCKPGVEESDVIELKFGEYPSWFAVWNECYVLLSGAELCIVDTASGEAEMVYTRQDVRSCSMDENGNLYFLTINPDSSARGYSVTKYSLEQKAELWKISLDEVVYFLPNTLSCTPGGGLFLLYPYEGKLLWLDPDTGEHQLMVDLTEDVAGLEDAWLEQGQCSIGVDGQYRLYVNVYYFDFNDPENEICRRQLYVLEPDRVEVDPADVVTLTITAPYKVDSVTAAARNYQREHPEVEFLWDTQFISREELQKNAMEYKDQIALRLMTGDVGDLVMVTGSGLGTETMTETDAFADLSAALDACPFRDELPDNLLDPLRGADGTIRGLPLGMLPNYYVWNQDLLEELDIDPYTVTWSQLLDLALEWQAQGADLSLAVSEAGIGLYSTKEQLFQDILLANLYDARQTDGSVRLDQPYLRELLEKFKALYDSSRLIRYDGRAGKALLVGCYSTGSVSDRLGWLQIAAEKTGVHMRPAPCPLGEVSQKRQGYAFCWAVSQTSEHKDAARDFLLFLASGNAMTEETQYSYTQDTLPVNTAAQGRWREYRERIQWNGWGTTEEMRDYFRQVQAAMDVPYVRFDQITGWYPAVAEPLAQYISGELTLDQAMEQANNNWERFLLE